MNIFLAFTPYHALLSCSAALSLAKSQNVLFIVDEFPEANILSKTLRDSNVKVFDEVLSLPGTYKSPGKNTLEKFFKRKKNVLFLKQFVASHPVENVFVGNDMRLEAQAMLHYAKSLYPHCKTTYLEDGTGAYESDAAKKRSLPAVLFFKLFFGSWFQDISVSGVLPTIDTCQLLFPELAREELKTKKITAVNKENFLKVSQNKTWQGYFNYFNFDVKKLETIDVLLMGLFSQSTNDYPHLKKVMGAILQSTQSKKLQLAVKYHPREEVNNFIPPQDVKNIVVLPKAIPLELLYIFSPKAPKLIIGGYSTAMLTARWIFPEAKIISVIPLLHYHDQNILEVFKKKNIHLVGNIKDLQAQLENIV